jgi:O-antigen/teichoic acid export membrane protein
MAPGSFGTTLLRLWRRAVEALRSGWLVYVGAAALSRVGAIFLVPLYTRRLSEQEYGAYSLVVSIAALLPLLLTFGLTSVVGKLYFDAQTPADARARVGEVGHRLMALSAGPALLFAGAGVLWWPNGLLGLEGRWVALLVLGCLGAAFSTVLETFFRASRAATSAVALQLFTFFSTASLGVYFVAYLNRGLGGAIEAIACASLMTGTFAVIFIFRLGRTNEPNFLSRWLPVSLPFVAHFIASWLLTMGDRWVLTAVGAEAKLGTYYLAVQMVSPALMLVATWNELDAARLGEQYRDQGISAARAGALRRTLVYFAVAVVGAVAVGAGSLLLPLLVGPKFVSAATYVPALLVAHLFESQYFVPSNLLFYAGRTSFIPVVTVTAGLLNVALAFVLWPSLQITGLLTARVTASLFRSVLMAAFAGRFATAEKRA